MFKFSKNEHTHINWNWGIGETIQGVNFNVIRRYNRMKTVDLVNRSNVSRLVN